MERLVSHQDRLALDMTKQSVTNCKVWYTKRRVIEIKSARTNLEISVLKFIQKVYGFVIFASNFHIYTAVADEL